MCGIVGIVLGDQTQLASPELFNASMILQHRGQDAAGMVTNGNGGRLYQCKGNGMARDVFTQKRMTGLIGNMGIAHLRYPTAGSSANSEAQPFYVNSPYGITLSHNGNLVNGSYLKEYLDKEVHRHINTDSDSELLLNIFAAKLQNYNKARVNNEDIFNALKGVYQECRGAYACTGMIAGYCVFGFRDPHGIRPLLFGERTHPETGVKDYMLASESIALEAAGFTNLRDFKPGEAVIIPRDTMVPEFRQVVPAKTFTPDIFEYVYFARTDSILDGVSVYRSRIKMGEKLAQNINRQFGGLAKENIDVVIPVPDTARHSALACAGELGIPYREGFNKNRYIGRTFIMPDQKERVSSVRRKLNAMSLEFKDRNVLLVDDSIVRGTTSKEIVQMAREAGAKKVFFASCAPPIRFNHIYGIDLADTRALVAYNRDDEQVSKEIHADRVFYQDLEDLKEACKYAGVDDFEVGVFTGKYITGVEDRYLQELEKVRAQNQRIKEIAARREAAEAAGESTAIGFDDVMDVSAKAADTDIGLYNVGDYQ
ncbi:amidophosphoribosyltransferase [Saccharomycopsis crataegensis]|uniref:Amidophosphoribosyltransferase n=1 Tax=Saccharomycopsis crataegensis TaxID=43959 RepID=A0AAV5QRS5_9ASCO|nr:amidophosphoribosyltransferase [Saccharomycopsis crataegensis]